MSEGASAMSELAMKALARELRRRKGELAAEANAEFFRRHPDWDVRYGERGRRHGQEDAAFLIEFLAGAIEAGLTAPFEDYARWTTGLLGARGISAAVVAESFEVMGEVLRARLSPEERAAAASFMAAGRAACAAWAEAPQRADEHAGGSLNLARSLFTGAILAGDRAAALDVALDALRRGASLVDLYADVLQEALVEVGRRWEAGAVTVAEEHVATAIVQFVLARVFGVLPRAGPPRGRALITGVAGELHQIGANMVADALEADGWSVRFLGSNVPAAGIVRAVEEHAPAVVGISATLLTSLAQVRELIEAIRSRPGPAAPRIIVGGGVFRRSPELAYGIGADAVAPDVRFAVAAFKHAGARLGS